MTWPADCTNGPTRLDSSDSSSIWVFASPAGDGAFDGSFLQSFGGFEEAFVCRQNIIFDGKNLIGVVIVL